MSTWQEEIEDKLKFKNKKNGINLTSIFSTLGSAGKNPVKLAQTLSAFDTIMCILGWQDKPLAKLTHFATQYQASIDGGYHRDYKEVLIAEEVERRREQRKGISILNS